ncbi:PREDICTED: uncharacterized protein LOC105152365 isoform X2 [Acromyrmex echinatior]|uniref:uncharacterized protein LOC105152365 isoform X1 n=1 Tax=Acromyrmex echinatior TaxID=103372 RepID=UPI000580D5F6|nr:PREDICTED: uncharacterized protein LOC105152365 isoform X1 [Acromyrmex echinatior]XP_011064900.1 PREDICTED: uncharacterized protein LOC105152365 isoform X2 [Acromyrmex echinatior]
MKKQRQQTSQHAYEEESRKVEVRDQINVGSSSTGVDGWKSRSTTDGFLRDGKKAIKINSISNVANIERLETSEYQSRRSEHTIK